LKKKKNTTQNNYEIGNSSNKMKTTEKKKTFSINYINRNLIIIISILISIFFVQKEISSLASVIDTGDENLNMLVVKNIAVTGLPVYGTFADNVTSPLFNNDALTLPYWEYATELYLRTPIYILSKIFNFKWEYYSSLFYLYLIFSIVIIYYLSRRKNEEEPELPILSVAFFILIFSISKLSASQFHWVRYYPFTLMIMSVIHYVTNLIFTYSNKKSLKKFLLIIFISFIPGIFHLANLSYFFFWVTYLCVIYINNFIFENKEKSIKYLFKKNKINMLIGLMVFIFLCFLGIFLMIFLKNRLYFSSENIKFIPGFLSYFFNVKFIVYDSLFLILSFFCIINFKKFSKIESVLFKTSFSFMFFCLIGFSVAGGNTIIANPYSYLLFMFPIIVTILSLMLTMVFRIINRLLPEFFLKDFVAFYLIAFLFIFINFQKLGENERKVPGTKKPFEKLEEIINQYKNCIILTSLNAHFFYNYFPQNKAFLYLPYKDEDYDTNKVKKNVLYGDYYVSNSGYVKNYGGEINVGSPKSFYRILKENENNVMYFFVLKTEYYSIFSNKLGKIYVGNPMSCKYLKNLMYGKDEKDTIQCCLNALNETGLLEIEYFSLGYYLLNHNLINESIKANLKVISLNPKNCDALINLGVSYFKLNKVKESVEIFKKILSIEPNSEMAKKYLKFALDKLNGS
jgi:hypothetical protein